MKKGGGLIVFRQSDKWFTDEIQTARKEVSKFKASTIYIVLAKFGEKLWSSFVYLTSVFYITRTEKCGKFKAKMSHREFERCGLERVRWSSIGEEKRLTECLASCSANPNSRCRFWQTNFSEFETGRAPVMDQNFWSKSNRKNASLFGVSLTGCFRF